MIGRGLQSFVLSVFRKGGCVIKKKEVRSVFPNHPKMIQKGGYKNAKEKLL